MRPDTVRKIEEPALEPVSLAAAKAQLGMTAEETQWDAFLIDKIGTARELIEARLGRTIIATRYRAKWATNPGELTLPHPPLLVDEDHPLTVTLDGAAVAGGDVETDADAWPAKVTIPSETGAVVVEYWGGLPPGSRISRKLHSAILLYVTHMFENRGVLAQDSSVELPQAFETLLAAESHNGGW
jgi:uncharacterized phiE125 gp8 family phage protein